MSVKNAEYIRCFLETQASISEILEGERWQIHGALLQTLNARYLVCNLWFAVPSRS